MAKGTGFVPCTNCGGSGATDKTEIYISTRMGNSRLGECASSVRNVEGVEDSTSKKIAVKGNRCYAISMKEGRNTEAAKDMKDNWWKEQDRETKRKIVQSGYPIDKQGRPKGHNVREMRNQ